MNAKRMAAVVDTHTSGAPTRIIVGGGPLLKGETFADRWLDFKENHDDFRRFVMWEPHGHDNMFGALLTRPVNPEAHYGIVFMDSDSSVSMCGHGSIGVSRTLIDLGMIKKKEPYTEVVLEAPAGLVKVKVEVKDGVVGDVILHNVPCFVQQKDVEITLPSTCQKVKLDIAFGGNYTAMVPADQFGFNIDLDEIKKMIPLGIEIRDAVNDQITFQHPTNPALNKIILTEFTLDAPQGEPKRNLVTWGAGQLARSACGTGTSARLACLADKRQLAPGVWFDHAGVTGSIFNGSYEPGPKVGEFDTVIPYIKGRSYITGFNWLIQQEEDELADGFFIKR